MQHAVGKLLLFLDAAVISRPVSAGLSATLKERSQCVEQKERNRELSDLILTCCALAVSLCL